MVPRKGDVSRIPSKDPVEPVLPTSVRLPVSMMEEIDAIAAEKNYSRSGAIVQLLRVALELERSERKPKK